MLRLSCSVLLLLLATATAGSVLRQGDGSSGDHKDCHKGKIRKRTVKTIKEIPFSGLFRDLKNSTVFEASGLAYVRGKFYTIFDNAMSIGIMDDRFQFRDPENRLIGEWEPESQFEGIAYVPENDTFLLLHEAVELGEEVYKPQVREVKLKKDLSGYDVHAVCTINFELEAENKGFESINYVHTPDGPFLLGLCEGNHCKGGEEGQDPGNGRIIVSELRWNKDGSCHWEPVKKIKIPESAYFKDYAAMAYNYEIRKLAILSQEDAAFWVGDFDGDSLEFVGEEGEVFHLPRDNHCEMIYCNAEGIQWVDHFRIVVTSDKAKSRQPYWCDQKDESVHLFAMPRAWDPYTTASKALAKAAAEEAAQEAEHAAAEL